MRQKLKTFILLIPIITGLLFVTGASVAGLTASDCASNKTMTQTLKDPNDPTGKHNITQTICAPLGSDSTNPIWHDLQNIVNALGAGVGLVVVGTIIVGGIQYIVAGDNPNGVAQAKGRIISGLIALAGFFLAWAILQWLIPGGVLKT